VSDFADVVKRLAGYPIALPERTTFYGMREIGVLAPGGHVVVFAAALARSEPGHSAPEQVGGLPHRSKKSWRRRNGRPGWWKAAWWLD
jgi:hypothetical protein